MKPIAKLVLSAFSLLAGALNSPAQGSAFTYQGRLSDGGNPVNGYFDLRFAVFDAMDSGNQVGTSKTNAATFLSNGTFTLKLDFGSSVFGGGPRWLEIGVRTNGSAGAYVTLGPRQALTATPYAITAANVTGVNIARLQVTNTASPASGVPVLFNGFIVGANVTGGGSGYISAPTVIVNDATGSGAVITATVSNGAVVALNVVSAGSGYSSGATLTISSPPSNAFQTFSGVNYFTDSNTFSSPNNSFVGSFSGNAAGLTNLAYTPMPWQTVPGTTQQAQPNTGYIVTNSTAVVITLPIAPPVGSRVRVVSTSTGGWRIAQNAGQTILAGNAAIQGFSIGENLVPRAFDTNWFQVASSADGTRLVAVVTNGFIYTSADSGVTWLPRDVVRGWNSVASSANGITLFATANFGGPGVAGVYKSQDAGRNWTHASPPANSCRFVACSADARIVVASINGLNGDALWRSMNYGQSWTQTAALELDWTSAASSADGTNWVAVAAGEQIYTSTDAGQSWTARETLRNWFAVASSADGKKLVAAVKGGLLYGSSDSGVNWSPFGAPAGNWQSVACSADGTRLVVALAGSTIYTSDSGVNWYSHEAGRNWISVASSADGTKLVAAVNGGQIYTSEAKPGLSTATTPGPTGSLVGAQWAAVELLYVGNNQLVSLSFVPTIIAY